MWLGYKNKKKNKLSEENNNNDDNDQPVINVVEFAGFKDKKLEEIRQVRETQPPFEWPHGPSPEETVLTEQDPNKPAREVDPDERTLLLSLAEGDFVMKGYIGVGASFICVGDRRGQIRFAANADKWHYVTDVTDKPQFWSLKDQLPKEPDVETDPPE